MVIKYGLMKPHNYNGGLPDPPEPPECDGEFRYDVCEGCSEYDECKRIAEDEIFDGKDMVGE